MSEAKKCDRCGSFYDRTTRSTFQNQHYHNYAILKSYNSDGPSGFVQRWDLCPDCRAQFIVFMEKGKNKEENNNAEPEEV